jgi:hypothetical protein
MSSSSLIRQDVVPLVTGYVLLMGALATGLRITRRTALRRGATGDGAASRPPTGGASRPPDGGASRPPDGAAASEPDQRELAADRGARSRRLSLTARTKPGWPRLSVHVLATAVGGYLVLMAIIIIYYFGVAPIAGNFVESAFSGCAMLIGLAAPVFVALSWLSARKGWRL